MARPRLTVLQVLPALAGGGVEEETLAIAAGLVQMGHRSMVVAAGGRMAETLIRQGSEHIDWPIGRKSPLTLRFIPRLRGLLGRERVDVVHARSRLPAWIAWMALGSLPQAQRPQFVTTVHGLYSVNRYSAIMTRGVRTIAISHCVERYLIDNYPLIDRRKIQVINRGVDNDHFTHGYRPPLPWLQTWQREFPQLVGRPVITLPGRLTRLKGHHDFLQLMSRLQAAGHPAVGLIVGDAAHQGYQQELLDRMRQLNLTNVVFIGHRTDIREIYAVSDIVLSLSRKPESFGRTVLEALSIGTPVLGYDHGGVGEILRNIFPGGLVALADVDGLAQKATACCSQRPIIARSHAYKLASMQAETIELYSTVVAGSQKSERKAA